MLLDRNSYSISLAGIIKVELGKFDLNLLKGRV